jgi:squalene-hopene/tetraprenyl-beta-curcumene cyclase
MMDPKFDDLLLALSRSSDYFLRTQHQDGYWVGELESNASITAEYLFFRRLMEDVAPERDAEVAKQLLAWQTDGGWSLYYGGPVDLNATIEAAVALQMAGVPDDDPAMVQAAEVVRSLGGVDKVRVFTRIWFALLGALSWDTIPAMPPEMMLLPDSSGLNIYRFASWARGTIVPLLVVLARPPEYKGPVPDLSPFYAANSAQRKRLSISLDARTGFAILDILLKKSNWLLKHNPWRKRALEMARQWILDHQEADGGWGGIQPAMVYSTLALASFPSDSEAVRRGQEAIESFGIQDNDGFRLQSCVSPGWDTPWVMLALAEAGFPPDHPVLERSAEWLLGQQSDVIGDWAVRAPGLPAGGWPFEFENSQYPDTDDTALVLMALQHVGIPSKEAFTRGLNWLLGMQNEDGGWAAFDRENHTALVEQIPFCDFGEVLDPSSADVTAHVLELMGRLGYGIDEIHVQRGLNYLWEQQEADGSWFGRWGVNYIYGTGAVLMALDALGVRAGDRRVDRAVDWLRAHQNVDGGWGETCLSYSDKAWRGRGPSTASQTAWAVLGLLSSGGAPDALDAGLRWLVEHQNEDGTWDEPYFTGTGFPGDFYIKYHEYRNYFPTLALARAYSKGVGGVQSASGMNSEAVIAAGTRFPSKLEISGNS